MKLANYSVLAKNTDEDPQKSGYPSLKVMKLAYELTRIAGAWRETKHGGLVHEDKSVLYEMILNGYDVNTLSLKINYPMNGCPICCWNPRRLQSRACTLPSNKKTIHHAKG